MEDSSSSCPVCNSNFPLSQLERHVNGHFEDDEIARDMELAYQIAMASPVQLLQQNDKCERKTPGCAQNDILWCDNRDSGSIDEKIYGLVGSQTKSDFYKIEDGLIFLLKRCLESENSTCILSGHVDHFQSLESEDDGWGCGWRNIQMLSSHLLKERDEAREVLFVGSGYVPDISSLQKWLEIAWERGFDEPGAEHFNYNVYGSQKWIGATECASLFRSFGLCARIVDFGPKKLESLFLSLPGSNPEQALADTYRGKRKAVQFYGPMDKYLVRRDCNAPETSSSGEKSSAPSLQLGETICCRENIEKESGRTSGSRQALIDWVWNYFSDNGLIQIGHNSVTMSGKAPLYFQHDGHSRTVIGIQVKHQPKGLQQYNLLILDPAHRTEALEKSLQRNVGWQKLIKRGAHTLKKSQYQFCYIDYGIASEAEIEQLKTINSVYNEI